MREKNMPRIYVLARREDFLAAHNFGFQETFEIQELLGDNLIFEMGQPTLVQGVDLESQEVFGLSRKRLGPGFLVERLC
jgi:hypothetical protein